MKKVMVGMSGGVDSSVAAMLLRDRGFEVMGVTLKLFSDEDISEAKKEGKTCCALSDVEDARSVAYRLGFEQNNIGIASAIGVIFLLIVLGLNAVQLMLNGYFRREK